MMGRAAVFLVWVALFVASDVIDSAGGTREMPCDGECPEYELLCSSPEYDVRKYKSGLWVSTTVRGTGITKGNLVGRLRLHKYMKGLNEENIKMAPTTPVVMQMRMRKSGSSPKRELTVSMVIPHDVSSDPPKPTDPTVVIDLVPETIVYVKTFPGQHAGFAPEQGARNFYKTLSEKEELFDHEDYFHMAQYDSPYPGLTAARNEIWIFAINEVSYRMLQATDSLASGRGIPACLQQDRKLLTWNKMVPANIPALTRERCPSSFCEGSKCPQYNVLERLDDMVEKRDYRNMQAIGYVATSCNYDTAVEQSYTPLWQRMNKTGISPADVKMFVTTIIQKREDLDGKKGCEKFFVLYYALDGAAKSSTGMAQTKDGRPKFRIPETIHALHGKSDVTTFYTKCFGGNVFYDPNSVTATGKLLLNTLKNAGKCALGDHLSVAEYHPQSRLFDRHNEIMIDSDDSCADQDGRPTLTYRLPMSSSYLNPVEVPDVSDLCKNTECAEFSVKMTLGDNLRLMSQDPAKFACTQSASPSCTYYQAYHKALHPILSYINGNNKEGVAMNMTKPLFGHVVPSNDTCGKSFVLCMFISEKYFDSPPQPLAESVRVVFDENEFVAYEKSFVGNFESSLIDVKVRERRDEMLSQLDGLEPFGVRYNPKLVWLTAYSDPGKEETVMKLFVRDDQNVNSSQKQSPKEDERSSGERYLPQPASCDQRECLPVRVVKDYGNFSEVFFPKVKGVYTKQNVCESGTSGRLLLQPIHKYFRGYNMEEDKIGEFPYPVSLRYRLFFETGDDEDHLCDAVYEMSVALPDRYAGNEIPGPISDKIQTFERNGTHMYVVAVPGIYSLETVRDKTYHLLVDLTREKLSIERYYSIIFTYDPPFTDAQDRMTYIGLVKQPQKEENTMGEEVVTSNEKEQATQ